MSLSAGEQLGPYRVIEKIGAGGMGEVYRARDPRLNRDVAIKVSSERFSERFSREAQAIAALNHPNICHLYDVGPNYLVMELVDGETLAERMRKGALALDEALPIAKQIADALDAAHEKGIVHRDLKPGNVKIKPDGTVKVLDFGLAKTGGMAALPSENSPTLSTAGATEAGVILGTAAYMSPEQAKGKQVDKRADIWSFGIVLYEMVTGKRLFHGETTTEILAGVLKEDLRWDAVPHPLRRLLRKCLERDPQNRLRHIGDVMSLVDEEPVVAQQGPSATQRGSWLWPCIATALLIAVVVLGYLYVHSSAPATAENQTRFQIPAPDGPTAFSLSPDGRGWRSDGKEIYYLSRDSKIMAVEVSTTPSFHAGEPKVLFPAPAGFVRGNTPGAFADAAPDGKRFFLVMPLIRATTTPAPGPFNTVLNWTAILKK